MGVISPSFLETRVWRGHRGYAECLRGDLRGRVLLKATHNVNLALCFLCRNKTLKPAIVPGTLWPSPTAAVEMSDPDKDAFKTLLEHLAECGWVITAEHIRLLLERPATSQPNCLLYMIWKVATINITCRSVRTNLLARSYEWLRVTDVFLNSLAFSISRPRKHECQQVLKNPHSLDDWTLYSAKYLKNSSSLSIHPFCLKCVREGLPLLTAEDLQRTAQKGPFKRTSLNDPIKDAHYWVTHFNDFKIHFIAFFFHFSPSCLVSCSQSRTSGQSFLVLAFSFPFALAFQR